MITSDTFSASNTIRELIVSGSLKPQDKIDMDGICQRYELKKSHVVEAFAILENERFFTFTLDLRYNRSV